MAGSGWIPPPRSPHRRVLADLTLQQPPLARPSVDSEKPPGAASTVQVPLVPRPLSNITEVASQATEGKGKENHTLVAATATNNAKTIRPHTADVASSLSVHKDSTLTRTSSQRARNATVRAEINTSVHPELSPSRSTESTLAFPDDSASPLAAASGRVGTLLIQIHRNRSKALIYGQLFVVGALSHQTWVSGEVLFFDVEIYNSTEKSIKRVELQLERTTTLHPTANTTPAAQDRQAEAMKEILARWNWRKGEDGWCGIAPHTQAAKIWNPIVPASQATMNTHSFEVRYSLSIFVPCTFSKAASVQIPITVVSPNSLGASRLQQHLQHGLPAYCNDAAYDSHGSPPKRHESQCTRKSRDRRRASTSSYLHEDDPRLVRGPDGRNDFEPDPNSVFMTSNPIPRASDELLSEMLQKLQQSMSPKKFARLSAIGIQHRKGLSAPAQSIPAMRPLSAIGAHLRRASSDEVRSRNVTSGNGLLSPSMIPTARASFDDDLLRPHHQRQRSRGPHLQAPIHQLGADPRHGSPSTAYSYGGSSSSVDSSDLDRFLRERRSFQIARRTSGNPFFKGAMYKERLRNGGRYGYRAARDRYDDYLATGIGDYGQYEFRDAIQDSQPTHDRPYFKSKASGSRVGSSHSGWKQARTLF